MKININEAGSLDVSDDIFNRDFNEGLVHQAVISYMAGARQGTKAQKNRSAVSGGGAKPWRQKGTGRARAGTSRSPIWRTGGVTFAAKPQDHSVKMNRKMYKAAMSCIWSELVRTNRVTVVEDFTLEVPKTKVLKQKLLEFNLSDVLIIREDVDVNLFLAARNIYGVDVRDVFALDPVSLVGYEHVMVTAAAIKKVEEALS